MDSNTENKHFYSVCTCGDKRHWECQYLAEAHMYVSVRTVIAAVAISINDKDIKLIKLLNVDK